MTGKNQFFRKDNSKLFKTFSIAWGIIVTALCLMPSSDLPKAGNIPHLDKIVHLSFYLIWALCSLMAITDRANSKKAHLIAILSGLFTYSLLIEILQWGLPFGRSFSAFDLIFNACGLISGCLTFQFFFAKKIR